MSDRAIRFLYACVAAGCLLAPAALVLMLVDCAHVVAPGPAPDPTCMQPCPPPPGAPPDLCCMDVMGARWSACAWNARARDGGADR
ncbi:MAG TPA: hypothetical protein VFJ24_08345 [Gaiellales bacterium]|nr:hypothetical protein [Gaiellales bacterium]